MIRVLGLALYGPLAASTRHRLLQYAPGLKTHGIELSVESLLGDEYLRRRFAGEGVPIVSTMTSVARRVRDLLRQRSYDVAIVHCEVLPLLPGWAEARLLRIPYIYDFDDAFQLKYESPRFRPVRWALANKFRAVIGHAACVTAGNEYLRSYALQHNRAVALLPTVVDPERFRVRQSHGESTEFTIGWIGSPSTSDYIDELRDPLRRLASEGPVRFIVVGASHPDIDGVHIESLPWSPVNEADALSRMDVGVMPLRDDEWSRGKCAFKLLQYMAAGLPVVASAVGANATVVSEESGFLVRDSESWLQALRTLRDNSDLRRQMGKTARDRVENCYSVDVHLPRLAKLIELTAERADVAGFLETEQR